LKLKDVVKLKDGAELKHDSIKTLMTEAIHHIDIVT
jgi:hypothetical protein